MFNINMTISKIDKINIYKKVLNILRTEGEYSFMCFTLNEVISRACNVNYTKADDLIKKYFEEFTRKNYIKITKRKNSNLNRAWDYNNYEGYKYRKLFLRTVIEKLEKELEI